jgi:hypothetical protein
MLAEAFVPPVHQGIYPSTEEIGVKRLKPGHDGLLNLTVSCKLPSTRVLLQWSKEMKITRCHVRAVGRMVQYLPIAAPCGWLCVAWRYRAAIHLFAATQVVFNELAPQQVGDEFQLVMCLLVAEI